MNRSENLRYILRVLLDERAEYADWQIPDSLTEQQTMMRTLLNLRPPYPAGEDFLKAQNMELQRQSADKGIAALSDIIPCRKDGRLYLWQGDITRLQVDAVVNAANSALLGCFAPMHRCIDNAIHSAAGVQLRLGLRPADAGARASGADGACENYGRLQPACPLCAAYGRPHCPQCRTDTPTGTGTGRLLQLLPCIGGRTLFAEHRFLLHLHGRVRISPKTSGRDCRRYGTRLFEYYGKYNH